MSLPETEAFYGLPIFQSEYAVTRERRTVVFHDWRERQARNFGRPSTGKWEPIDFETDVDVPACYIVNQSGRAVIFVHPSLTDRLLDTPPIPRFPF